MGLRIIPASDPMRVETIVLTIYAPPGVGKTSLAFSAHAPLLLDTDQGAYRSAFRRDAAEARTWGDIAGITAADVKPYRTLVMDTAGRALDLLGADIIASNPKMGRGGALTLQGYGELKTRFAAYLKLMRSFGLDIVLVAHSDEKQQGDEIIERIDMQGSSKQEVYKSSDAMARLAIVGGQRVLTFSPTETQFGKDPAGLGRVEVPDLAAEPEFLGGVIDDIKDSLNALSEAQQEAAARQAKWMATCARASTPEDFTALIPEAEDDRAKRSLLEAAVAKGLTFDRDAGAFVQPAEQPSTNGAGKKPEPEPEPEPKPEGGNSPPITDKQRKRFYAIAKGAGYSDDGIKAMLAKNFQIESSTELTREMYDIACELAEDEETAQRYEREMAGAASGELDL